jgi:putative endopeptidase
MGYALGWLDHSREEALRNLVLTDYHAPARFRINGPLANITEFHETFAVKPGSPMHMPDSLRVQIW